MLAVWCYCWWWRTICNDEWSWFFFHNILDDVVFVVAVLRRDKNIIAAVAAAAGCGHRVIYFCEKFDVYFSCGLIFEKRSVSIYVYTRRLLTKYKLLIFFCYSYGMLYLFEWYVLFCAASWTRWYYYCYHFVIGLYNIVHGTHKLI